MPFSDIIGQDRAVEILKREWASGRLSHAYLFTGMEGVGKKQTAEALAMAAQCESSGADACGACRSCRKIRAGQHPDVRLYGPMAKTKGATEKIYIEQVRTLQEEISLCPMEGRKKVFIIDDADRMVDQAANALLKTLEEPPGDALLILITSYPDQLPATVLSRCRAVRFRPLAEEAVRKILVEKQQLPGDRAARLARYSQGSVARVLEMEEADALARRDRFLEWIEACDLGDIGSVVELSGRFAGQSNEAIEFTEFYLSWIRDLISVKVRGSGVGLIHVEHASRLEAESGRRDLAELLRNAEILEETLGRLRMNINQRLALEDGLCRMGQ